MRTPVVARLAPLGAAVLALGVLPGIAAPSQAAEPDPIFTPAPDFEPRRGAALAPRDYAASRVDVGRLEGLLSRAPAPSTAARGAERLTVAIPDPSGTLVEFAVQEASVLSPELAEQFPEIQTFAGNGITDPTRTVRLDITPFGFHASVRAPGEERAWYVDPAHPTSGTSTHLSYYGAALPTPEDAFLERGLAGSERALKGAARTPAGGVVQRRSYRLVMMSDPSYAAYWDGGPGDSDADVLAAKATLMNRVNQIYNDDLAITMTLVGDAAKTNQETDAEYTANGYTAGADCDGAMLGDNQTAVDTLVGAANYDVGHIVLGINGGGIATLGVVGQTGLEARGCTGLPDPKGDFFAIDYVAHELGHQFDGNHTFNSEESGCGFTNRNGATSVEPGSGSSVMAYAGICGTDDLQPHTDPYFSQRTIDEITTYVETGPQDAGGTATATANHAPAVTAPADRSIPVRTPFTLTGSGNDVDGTPLNYLWEQNDIGAGSSDLQSNTRTNGPLFRVFGDNAEVTFADSLQSPSPGQNADDDSPSRTFPDLAQVLADNTNAETGTCPSASGGSADATLDCYSEFLPNATYVGPMHFRLTARDGFATGGGTQFDDVTITPVPTAGPFQVTSRPTAGAPATGGAVEAITWDVNGTNIPSLATDVRISLSTDGGLTFPMLLAGSTPNDGSADVILPNVGTTQARVKVEAVGNYFFDVNDASFTIAAGAPADPPTVSDPADQTVQHTDSFDPAVPFTASSDDTDGDQLTATVTGIPGLTVTRTAASADGVRPGTATFAIDGAVTALAGLRGATVTVAEAGGGTASQDFLVNVTREDATVSYTGDTTGTTAGASATVTLSTDVVDAADGEPGDITLAGVRFVDRGTATTLCTDTTVTGGPATGQASCTVSLAATGATTPYTVGTVVTGPYVRDDAADDVTVTITRTPPPVDPPTVSDPADQVLQYSDSFDPAVPVTASSDDTDGDQLTATVNGVPGLTVTRTAASADGVRPGTATFEVDGAVTGVPQVRTATVTVAETAGGSASSDFLVTTTQEDATVAYTGDTAKTTAGATALVTLSTDVTDAADGERGDITNADVRFVDRGTGSTLCTDATVTGGPATGQASCSVLLPATGATTTYTVGTVVFASHTRDAAADDVTVTVTRTATPPPPPPPPPPPVDPPTVPDPADRTVQYGDSFDPPLTVTATSDDTDGDQLTATISGATGLRVTRTTTSADGVRPGSATFRIDGAVTDLPGTLNARLTVSEAGGGSVSREFQVVVSPEDATVRYTGDTTKDTAGPTAIVTLSTEVADVDDGEPGDVRNAEVGFVDRDSGATLCTDSSVTGGATTGEASCSVLLPADGATTTYTIGTVVTGAHARDAAADDVTVTVTRTGTPPPTDPPPTDPPDTDKQEIDPALKLRHLNRAGKDKDRVIVRARSAAGADVRLFRIVRASLPGPRRILLREGTLNAKGNVKWFFGDGNDRRGSRRFKAVVKATPTTERENTGIGRIR